ncbi:ABC transporter ATP-binding protein [Comamonadaceae bacterium OH2545_COT-014]|nr:ABC transporter ATP-binding protein [Comamonadaceae bacterium OH2545_COT-014]
MPPPLLQARDLRVTLRTPRGEAAAVRGLSFTLERGETLGLIGESGSGKSMTALALMGLAPEGAALSGSLQLDGQELLGLHERAWCDIRGRRIAMIFQEPMTALNPVHPIGRQVAEPMRLHQGLSAAAARQRTVELLARVGIAEPEHRLGAFPHQFSGGQRQRIMIAMALACAPDVLVADEPTTALDATVQRQVLRLISELVAERGMALLLISHDLALVAQSVQRMMVMYGGIVVEEGTTERVFNHPAHPYTRGLLAARPHLAQRLAGHAGDRLPTIAGSVPELWALPPGCTFAGRCAFTAPGCAHAAPPAVALPAPGHLARCLRPEALTAPAGA